MSKASQAAFESLRAKASKQRPPRAWRLGVELVGPWAIGGEGELPEPGQALIFFGADGMARARLGALANAAIVEEVGPGFLEMSLSLGEGASLRWLASRESGCVASSRKIEIELGERSRVEMISSFGLADGESHAEMLAVHFVGKSAAASLVGRYAQDVRSSLCQEVMGHIGKNAAGAQFSQSAKTLRFGHPALSLIEPNLKVEVDEASASHGAAHGAVSPEALHALQARGVEAGDALAMLRSAFLRQPWEASGATAEELGQLKIQKEQTWS